jgi:hypothetical protein
MAIFHPMSNLDPSSRDRSYYGAIAGMRTSMNTPSEAAAREKQCLLSKVPVQDLTVRNRPLFGHCDLTKPTTASSAKRVIYVGRDNRS